MLDKKTIYNQLEKFEGTYEIHISILDTFDNNKFYEICKLLKVKPIIIDFNNDKTKNQPMISKKIKDSPKNTLELIEKMYKIMLDNFSITRLKIEADINNKNIPLLDEQHDKNCYFENHLRLIWDKNILEKKLAQELRVYNGHLSKNSLSNNKNRFVTQRFYKYGYHKAKEELEKLCNFIDSKNIKYDKKIYEYTIYDSNLELDSSWTNNGKEY
ncbi:MAG: hypothetical protein U0457_13395 [Candidatus Sericytochromatia bacterium]